MTVVLREDIVDQQSLNEAHPRKDDIYCAYVPHIGSGNDVVNIVSGQLETFEDPNTSKNTNFIWNADGSVSPNEDSAGGNSSSVNHMGMVVSKELTAAEQTNKAIVFVIDLDQTGKVSGKSSIMFWRSQYQKEIKFNNEAYQSQVQRFRAENSGTVGSHDETSIAGRNVYLFYVDSVTGDWQEYKNGSLLASGNLGPISWGNASFRFGIGNSKTKFYSSYMMIGEAFTNSELLDLASNPYQIFDSGASASTDYQIVVAAAKQTSKVSAVTAAVKAAITINSVKQVSKVNALDIQSQSKLTVSSAKQQSKTSFVDVAIDSLIQTSSAVQKATTAAVTISADSILETRAAIQKSKVTSIDFTVASVNSLSVHSAKQKSVVASLEITAESLIQTSSARQISKTTPIDLAVGHYVENSNVKQSATVTSINLDLKALVETSSARQVSRASVVTWLTSGLEPVSIFEESNVVLIKTTPERYLTSTTTQNIIHSTTVQYELLET